MNGEYNMFLWISAGVCFIIIVVISIFNFFRISNLETETDNLQISLRNETNSNIQTMMDEDYSNLQAEIKEMKESLQSNINSNVNYIIESQKIVDSNQNVMIDKNELDIFNIGSNITHVIEPQMLVFDGQFKSLEADIQSNDTELAQLSTHVASQIILNDQFSNQNVELQTEINAILEKDFGSKINTLRTNLTANIDKNAQDITNMATLIDNNYTSLSNMDYTLLQSNIELDRRLGELALSSEALATVTDALIK